MAITDLKTQLLNIEAHGVDINQPLLMSNDMAGNEVFRRYCETVLELYRKSFPGITSAWVCIAGIEPGCLKETGSSPASIRWQVQQITRTDANLLAIEGHEAFLPSEHPVITTTVSGSKHGLAVRLVGYKEYYGVLVFFSQTDRFFSGDCLSNIIETVPLLNRLMAEAVFSKRLKTFAAPMKFAGIERKDIYHPLAQRACLGLAADGSVLRIRKLDEQHSGGYLLDAVGHFGLLAGSEQLRPGSVFERLCRKLYESPNFVTYQTLHANGTRTGFPESIDELDAEELREFGVHAYVIIKLQSDMDGDDLPPAIGTLSVFHRLPQSFSGRDISLFRSFCERVADDLVLLDQRDENEALARILEAQNSLGTRAEITALLGHDFGHRVYHVQTDLDDFIRDCTRHWEGRLLPESIRQSGEALKKSCVELAEIVRQIRLLGPGADEQPVVFSVLEVFNAINEQLRPVLQRHNMILDRKTTGDCRTKGVRGILLQALYNLVINSIDAHKSSKIRKQNAVHLTCKEIGKGSSRKLEFTIWDEGPGISRNDFPEAQRIFDIGTTSKPHGVGTGTGLPAARSLLGKYFHASLQLVDRNKALFQFSIPAAE